MKIGVQSIQFKADKNLLAFVEKKVNKLNLFFDQIIDSEVYLKVSNASTGTNKIAEIKIKIPGNTLFAKEQCKSFEEATDLSVESLRKQIHRHKMKNKDLEVKYKKNNFE